MDKKKGIVAAQLTWVFVLIAGAIILIFFFNLSMKHKEVAQQKLFITLSARVNSLFTSAQQTSDTFFKMKLPGTAMSYDCEGYRVGSSAPATLGASFSPSIIKSVTDTFIIFSKEWDLPFAVTNFLYITSPGVRYIFIRQNGDDVYNKLLRDLPSNLTFEERDNVGALRRMVDSHNYRVRVVSFHGDIKGETMPVNGEKTGLYVEFDSSAMLLDPSAGFRGKVTFYNYSNNRFEKIKGAEYNFTGEAMLMAAIFADRPENFECGMRRAYERFFPVTELLIDKADRLADALTGECKVDANVMKNELDALNRTMYNYKQFPKGVELDKLLKKEKEVASANSQLELYSCPLIY